MIFFKILYVSMKLTGPDQVIFKTLFNIYIYYNYIKFYYNSNNQLT